MDTRLFCAATGATENAARIWAPLAQQAATEFGIDTPLYLAGFLAQMSVESGKFTTFMESLNYSPEGLAATWPNRFRGPNALAIKLGRGPNKPADQQGIANLCYGGRFGNTQPGDGWKYRGRGPKQITFHDNYRDAGRGIGVDLVSAPDKLLTPLIGIRAAAWYWKSRNINALMDRRDYKAVSRAVNGGDIGLEKRLAQHQTANRVFGVA
jgi:putative chitinase